MALFDLAIFAGLCWLPVCMYWLSRVTGMPGPLVWLTTAITTMLGPVQFATAVAPIWRSQFSVLPHDATPEKP